ncbi:MAG: ATP-dependent RecD-like DNA helicase [Lachnospiraceae bacterium]|nr:ATP-dependent RecD-like DNA helicase [Lachnospiraceae bacterium]
MEEQNKIEELEGYVDHIIFRNQDNGYTVLNFISDEEEITCVGIFPVVNEGEILLLRGEYTSHPSYGEQFKVASMEAKAPTDVVSMERYLASGAIKGIGVALAARIVRWFGEDTFRIIEEQPERLAEVKGISKKKAMEISDAMMEKKDLRDAMIFLSGYGVSTTLAVRIYNTYGYDLYKIVKENPYKLAEDITGVGFKIADEIASRVGISADSDFRIKSGILYALGLGAMSGHTCLPREELVRYTSGLLGVDPSGVDALISNLAMDKKVVVKGDFIYARWYDYVESSIASLLCSLNQRYPESEDKMDAYIERVQREENVELDEWQKEAVKQAVTNGLFVITGGPGTGKTTTIRAIINYYDSEGYDIMLAAPTGRAAKRMSEATGYEAKTIHRLLEVNGAMPEEDDGSAASARGMFERNENNPLEADVVIIDEVSMVDVNLMHALLKAIPVGGRLILVGDVNQLPSVGPGNVLRDIIQSGTFETVTLQKVFRQAATSDIVMNAHRINEGEHVVADNKSEDFFLLRRRDANGIITTMIELVSKKLPKYVQATPLDIQVLTPTRKGLVGVENLNIQLQKYLNPANINKKEREFGGKIFREGDKVMQTKNNYQLEWEIRSKYGIAIDKGLGVFNGDVGILTEINEYTSSLWVKYDDGRMVEYPFKNVDELELAYAITIHKSQGSEYPAVVMPLLPGPRMLMNRNLLYTGITRAKKCLTIVGDEATFYEMIDNESQQKRYSGLRERIETIVSM